MSAHPVTVRNMNQASYDLSRLARNRLIRRIPSRNRYTLTRDGLLFAHFYTKVYEPRPAAADGTRPAQRAAGAHRSAGHPRPARRRPHRQRPPLHRSLTFRHHAQPAASRFPACPKQNPHHYLLTPLKD